MGEGLGEKPSLFLEKFNLHETFAECCGAGSVLRAKRAEKNQTHFGEYHQGEGQGKDVF